MPAWDILYTIGRTITPKIIMKNGTSLLFVNRSRNIIIAIINAKTISALSKSEAFIAVESFKPTKYRPIPINSATPTNNYD